MKNILLIVIASLFTLNISAQETDSILRSKKGTPILPQAGDWAIGADAGPYLSYFGNLFNNSTSNDLDLGNQTLYLRYFLTDNTAIRLLVGLNKSNSISRHNVRDDAAFFQDVLSRAVTEDKSTVNYNETDFDLGYQIFRGYGRLRGFYGAHLTYSLNRTRTEYTYGNPMTSVNPTPSSYFTYNGSARTLESDGGYYHSVGIGLIGGVEYYFAPKICIGGELTLSAYNTWKTQGNVKTELWNGSQVVEMDTENSPAGRTSTGVYTHQPSNFNGSLYLMFHF